LPNIAKNILNEIHTGCVYGRENILDKKFLKSDGREGYLSYTYIFDLYGTYSWKCRYLNEIHTGCMYGRENILDKKFLKLDWREECPP